MQIFSIEDVMGRQHHYLILPIRASEFERMKTFFDEHIPLVSYIGMMRKGHPIIAVDWESFRFAIPLDEVFYSGEMLGEKLEVGDLLTIIWTSIPQDKAVKFIEKDRRLVFNIPMEKMIATTIKYSEEIDELYRFYILLKVGQPRPLSIRDSMKIVLNEFSLMENTDGVELNLLLKALKSKHDIDNDIALRLIKQLKKENLIYEPKNGYFKLKKLPNNKSHSA